MYIISSGYSILYFVYATPGKDLKSAANMHFMMSFLLSLASIATLLFLLRVPDDKMPGWRPKPDEIIPIEWLIGWYLGLIGSVIKFVTLLPQIHYNYVNSTSGGIGPSYVVLGISANLVTAVASQMLGINLLTVIYLWARTSTFVILLGQIWYYGM